MRHFELTVRFPGGGPLIGGAATTPQGFHASHAMLDGRPYLPATALRGALRESFEAVLRGTGEHRACTGGDGLDPGCGDGAAPAQIPTGSCELGPGGAPCLACRLFGTHRPLIGSGERAFSGLILGDASLVGDAKWTARPGVAIDRARRSASDNQLVFQRVPQSPDGPLTFRARGRVSDAALEPYLEVAIRATTHVGSGRSRGLARVELALAWTDPEMPWHVAPHAATKGDLLLRITLTSPTLLGASTIDGNYRETRSEISGATLRGAIGFALRELVDDADRDPATQDLLDAEHGARFGFLYPTDAARCDHDAGGDGPLPITAVACKREQRAHDLVDTLLDRVVLLHATSAAEAECAARQAIHVCRQCAPHSPLRAARGSRRAAPPKTRTVVRVSMDRTRQSARDGHLFSQVLLVPGATFVGTIRNIPPQGRQRLLQALGSSIVSFGRGRSAGWGQACIAVEPATARASLEERATAFDRALRARLDRAGLRSDRVGRLVPVTLLSPLWPVDAGNPDEDGRLELCEAVAPAACMLAARRFVREGAWDQRTGTMATFRATAAGGVFVLELDQATWRDLVDRLVLLEQQGIGHRRDQGYGQVLCFDPLFTVSQQNG